VGVIRQTLALVLTVLLANPVCCCTLGDLFAADDNGDRKGSVPSCCAKKQSAPGEQQPSAPDKAPSCPCADDDMAVEKVQSPQIDRGDRHDLALEAPSVRVVELLAVRGGLPGAAKLDLPPPGPSWRVFCCYLL
jgi:hypothetical protein